MAIIKALNNYLGFLISLSLLLFLIIETSPIFVKLIALKGEYDFKLEDQETAIKTWVQQQVLQREEILQGDILIHKKKSNQELYTCKKLPEI